MQIVRCPEKSFYISRWEKLGVWFIPEVGKFRYFHLEVNIE